MTKPKRVVITGQGIASPIGHDTSTYCQNLYQGQYGIRPITTFDTSKRKTKVASFLDPLPIPTRLTPLEIKLSSNLSRLTLFCVEQAVSQANLDFSHQNLAQIGVIVGSGFFNLYDLENFYQNLYQHDKLPPPSGIPLFMASAPATRVAMHYGLTGVVKSVSTACSSGFTALAESVQLIQAGEQELIIAGGSDLVVCETVTIAWERMRVLSKEKKDPNLACRPFDRNRQGLVLGDGAAFFVLESYQHARQRGATILAEISGIFQNSDSVDLVKPQVKGQTECITQTLQHAQLEPHDIGMIYAHATGTRLNDITEYNSLLNVFQSHLKEIPLCGLKSMLGHTMGASGPMALVAALSTLESGYFYPIPSLHQPEKGIELLTTPQGQIIDSIDHILINTFAFGGINVSLIISNLQGE